MPILFIIIFSGRWISHITICRSVAVCAGVVSVHRNASLSVCLTDSLSWDDQAIPVHPAEQDAKPACRKPGRQPVRRTQTVGRQATD